jgi:hypothetical protein
LIERLETANHCQQIEPITAQIGLDVGHLDLFGAIERLHDKAPLAIRIVAVGLG